MPHSVGLDATAVAPFLNAFEPGVEPFGPRRLPDAGAICPRAMSAPALPAGAARPGSGAGLLDPWLVDPWLVDPWLVDHGDRPGRAAFSDGHFSGGYLGDRHHDRHHSPGSGVQSHPDQDPLTGLSQLIRYAGELSPTDDYNAQRRAAFKDDFVLHIGGALDEAGGEISKIRLSLDSSEFDPYLQLIDQATGAVVAWDDDSGYGLNAELKREVVAGDRFLVRVTSYSPAETGSYRLNLSTDRLGGGLNPSPTPEPPGLPSPIDGTLPPDPSQFQPRTGYGLVDSAAAVAAALTLALLDRPDPLDPLEPLETLGPVEPFGAIADLGGVNSGLDLLQVPEVWAQGFTGAGVVVAVIDSGLDLSHPELQGSLWTNPGEIAGDGLDNDQNGYVDDLHGWNFGLGQLNGDVSPGSNTRFQGHGTHVAGIIAGANDGQGNSGVAYDAQIMALRLGDTNDAGAFLNAGDLAQAIRYAVDNGAQVINLSLGWADSPDLRQALVYAAERNAIVVSAAGNSGGSLPVAPARYATDWGISVGAVSRSGRLATFSNGAGQFSTLRHVLAPGTSITSAEPGGGYESRTGTSMAAPFVSGVVALMLSANPDLTALQVRDILARTALQLDVLLS